MPSPVDVPEIVSRALDLSRQRGFITSTRHETGRLLAALAAALTVLDTPEWADVELVALLAADLAGVTGDTVARLASALRGVEGADGALLVDEGGRRQWLLGVWRKHALATAVPTDPRGASLRGTLGTLSIVEVSALAGEARDVDTPEDLRP